jgi:HAD superfamily hydrolase (TIGR01490 family)
VAVTGRAAFFDMDRTLVRVNTANLYIKWQLARGRTRKRDALRALGWLAQYKLGIVDGAAVAARALRSLEGVREERFRDECAAWYETDVRVHIAQSARREVLARKREGFICAILTASTKYASSPLADELGIEHVICTELEVEGGRFTGGYEEPLCYGVGKVERAERWASELGVDLSRSVFYTDSVSDVPMLERVGEPRVVNPDPRLRVRAAFERWPVERWT